MQQIENFNIIGIETQTSNESGKAAVDLGKLWEQFYVENIPSKIPNKTSEEVYSIYTDYESDYTGKYTCIIGLKVDSIDTIPEGLVGRNFKGGSYQKFVAKGQMPHAVLESWQEIWKLDKELNRKYTADFEVYGVKAQKGDDSEVEIYIEITPSKII